MRAGEMGQRVIIQQATTTPDAILGRSESWATLAEVWAAVTPTAANERMESEQVGAYTQWDVTVRYRTDVTPKMRVSWASKVLQIVGIEPIGRLQREFTRLRCEERT